MIFIGFYKICSVYIEMDDNGGVCVLLIGVVCFVSVYLFVCGKRYFFRGN